MQKLRKKTKRYRVYRTPKTQTRARSGAREDERYQVPEHPSVEDLGESRVNEIRRIIGGELSEAKQVSTLELSNPYATLPELVAMNWLNQNHHVYIAQAPVLGGRQAGGLVPDFLIRKGGGWTAWLVQGTYYHSSGFQERHMQMGRDVAAKLRLQNSPFNGLPIKTVVTLNEDQVYEERPLIFDLAILGQELPF